VDFNGDRGTGIIGDGAHRDVGSSDGRIRRRVDLSDEL